MNISFSNESGVKINPGMIGLFFEDINYAADGGLYGELLENRNFSFFKAFGDWGDYFCTPDYEYGWAALNNQGSFKVVTGSSHSKNNPYYARIEGQAGFGIINKAYEGIYADKNTAFNVYFYARSRKYEGRYFVGLLNDNELQDIVYISSKDCSEESYNHWKKYSLELQVSKQVENAKFVFGIENEGIVELDFISVIPSNAPLGIFRKDLYDLLKDLHPGFIRFPGGCIVEGNTLDNRYDYKNTLRPCYDRKTNYNRWAVHGTNKDNNYETQYSHYNQTFGLGFYEYFLLCDSIGSKPLPVLNVGFSCQYQNDEIYAIDSPEFKNFIQDALDLIEFANGDINSKWGSVRASLGRIRPFGLEMLGIGNEQWQTKNHDFFERYLAFEKAIHEVYPEIKLIGSAGPDITSEKYTMAWDFYRKHKDEKDFAYALDEHYYVKPEWLFEHNTFYDNYDRQIKVFSGEYAAHPCSGFNMPEANTLYGALSEAAFMTGIERNADEVVLASYAPLFARVGYAQWSPDMIWFDKKTAYGSPSYYVQSMFANNVGNETVLINELIDLRNDGIYVSASKLNDDNTYIIKLVNSNETPYSVNLSSLMSIKEGKSAIASVLTGKEKDSYNCIDNPKNVTMESRCIRIDEDIVLEPLSFSVIRF